MALRISTSYSWHALALCCGSLVDYVVIVILPTLIWILIFSASLFAILGAPRRIFLPPLLLAYAGAAGLGYLSWPALLPIALLLLAAFLLLRTPYAWAGHGLLVLTSVTLALHGFAGFDNVQLMRAQVLSPGAVPFSWYLNFDKPLIGFWLLALWPHIAQRQPWRLSLPSAILGIVVAVLLIVPLAVWLGVLTWAPKWPDLGWLWLINNVLLVAMAEEAFFRGYLQTRLRALWQAKPYGNLAALIVAALAFALAHAAGGWQWVLLAMLAGLCNGVVYRYGGLLAAMGAHAGLNALHFALLTYPMLSMA